MGTQSVLEAASGEIGRCFWVGSSGSPRSSPTPSRSRRRIETIRRQVAAHRAQGLKLVESGGNPDPALAQGETAQAEVLAALREGDPDAAGPEADRSAGVGPGGPAHDRTSPEGPVVLRPRSRRPESRETERLRTAMTQAESYQADLERDFAPSSWTAVARNLDQAHALFATFDRQVQDAVAVASTTSQEYLKGSRLLEELARQQQIVLRLMSGLGEQLSSLIAVRDESRSLIDQLAASERQADSLIRQNDLIVGDAARASLAKAQQIRQEILLRSAKSRPDWPALRQSLAEAIEDVSIAQSQAEEEIKNYRAIEFRVRGDSPRRRPCLCVARQPSGRPVGGQSALPGGGRRTRPGRHGDPGTARGRGAPGSPRCATPPAISSARNSSLAKIFGWPSKLSPRSANARRPSIGPRLWLGWASIPTSATPRRSSCRPSSFCASQEYEQSIQRAGAATQLARQLHYAAMQQAMLEQMAVEAEQRRRAARMAGPYGDGISFGAAAATAAAATILERNMSASEPPHPRPPPEPEPATAGGSWGGETAQGNW